MPFCIQKYGVIDYNTRSGVCDFIPSDELDTNPESVTILIALLFPSGLVTISYSYIGWYFFKSHNHLQTAHDSEFYTTWILFLAFLFHALVLAVKNVLFYIWQTYDLNIEVPYRTSVFICYLPYCTNFIIYSMSTQYRKSYLYFLKRLKNIFNHQEQMSKVTSGEGIVTIGIEGRR